MVQKAKLDSLENKFLYLYAVLLTKAVMESYCFLIKDIYIEAVYSFFLEN